MQDTLKLKKNEAGETVLVVSQTTTNELPLSADELKRQIKQHAEVIINLQRQLEVVSQFEAGEEVETSVSLPVEPIDPIVDRQVLEQVTTKREKEESGSEPIDTRAGN